MINKTVEPSELRIGNWVYDNSIGYSDRVIGNRQVSHELIYSICCDNNNIYPISLSDFWFLKLGFDKVSNNKYRRNIFDDSIYEYLLIEVKDDKTIEVSLIIYENIFNQTKLILPNIKFVHQLQNLFFSLNTNKEL